MDVINRPSNDYGSDTELILSEPSSSLEQDATIQFSHQRFVPPDFLKPESGDHPEIAPFLTEEPLTSPSLIKRSLGLSKASFSSLTSSRQGSSSNILYTNRGGADSQILSDFCGQPLSDFSLREQGSSRGKMKKLTDILKKRSRGRLSSDTGSSSQMALISSYASASTETFITPSFHLPCQYSRKTRKRKGDSKSHDHFPMHQVLHCPPQRVMN